MADANVVPPDAEKMVFAVDIVRFFLNRHHSHLSFKLIKSYITNDVNLYRPKVRQLFNDNIEKVLKDISNKQSLSVRSDYLEVQNKDGINGSSLKDYITSFKNDHLDEDYQVGNFLTYCAQIASMSSLFYANGCNEALDIGVDFIKSSFPDDPEKYKLISESMENAALKYVSDSSGDKSPFLIRRDPEPEFSGTEDSSGSSAIASETDSDESLTTLIHRLNASVGVKGCRIKKKQSIFESGAVAAAAIESSEESIQNPTVSSSSSSRLSEALKCEIDMSSKIESYFKGVEGEPTLTLEPSKKTTPGKSSSSGLAEAIKCDIDMSSKIQRYFEGEPTLTLEPPKRSILGKSSSSGLAEALKCDIDMSSKIESYFKGVEGEPTLALEPPKRSILDKSSGLAQALKCDIDIPSKIESYFKGVEGEPTLALEPPKRSILGKRPSPRKENPSDSASEDSETEVKKPKFGGAKTNDENE